MSKAHSGSRLILKNQIAPVQFDTAHFNFKEDATGIQYGQIIYPTGTPVYTLRDDGIFGNCIAIEEGTTNLISNGNFSNGLTGWSTGGTNTNPSTMTATIFDGKTCLYQDVGVFSETNYKYYRINLPANTTYTMSFLIYRLEGTITFDPNGPWNTAYSLTPEIGKWIRHSYTFTTDATGGTEDFHFYANASRAKYYLTDVQLEQKTFSTSFVNGSRAIGNLKYNLKPNANFTLSFWIKANSISTTQYIYDTRTGSIDGMGIHDDASGKLRFYTHDGTAFTYLDTITSVLNNNWHHVAVTLSSSFEKKIYVDGELERTQTQTSVTLGSSITIGSRYNSVEHLNGLISELRVDNKAMSDEEIKAWYISQSPPYNPYDTRAYAY